MVLHEFPDLKWLKKQAEDGFANRKAIGGQTLPTTGWPSVILNTKATDIVRDNIRGPLSIFSNVHGKSVVTTGKKRSIVAEGFFFVTNQDQHYTLEIGEQTTTETVNVHFGEYFADQVYMSIRQSPDKLIDDPLFVAPFERVELYNKLYPKSQPVHTLLLEASRCTSDIREQELLFELLVELLREDRRIKKITSEIPALKRSTRTELLKRLLTATDYIYSFYDKDISLEELAGVCCLSKFHFLRLFKLAFHQTPHQFINHVKIDRAKTILKQSGDDIKIISRNLGFQDPSSFSRVFFQFTGVYPTDFRK